MDEEQMDDFYDEDDSICARETESMDSYYLGSNPPKLSSRETARSNSDHQLSEQIIELQDAVKEMKRAFTLALHELGSVEKDDNGIKTLLEKYRMESQEQISEVVKLILSMKAEFSIVKSQVQLVQEFQYGLQQQVHNLLFERDVLIEELENVGVLSDHARKRLLHCRTAHQPTSGSQSNDSGVAFLLEKAQAAFNQNRTTLSPQSDQDSNSIPENCAKRVSSLVHDYLVGLGQNQDGNAATPGINLQDSDSDSSLTIAANKSLTLSTSLGKQCGLEFDHHLKEASNLQITNSQVDGQVDHVDSTKKLVLGAKRSISQERPSKEKSKIKIIKDLVETERIYCKTLSTLKDTFAEPLKKSGILTTRDINTMFPEEINQLYEKHCTLLQKLEDRLSSWRLNGTVADIFECFTDQDQSNILGLYNRYVNDFPEVIKTFHKSCQKSIDFTKFLKSCLDQPNCIHNDVGTLLLAPVQRIPAYILILKQMLKCTEENENEIALKSCLYRLKEFLGRLNDAMEHSFQLIAGQIISTSDFLCEDKFIDDDYNDNESTHNAETILIDDGSDMDSLRGKIDAIKADFEANSVTGTGLSYENESYEQLNSNIQSVMHFQETKPAPVKNKQVPKKPPRTPRKTNCQSEIIQHTYPIKTSPLMEEPKQTSSPDVSRIMPPYHVISYCCESNHEVCLNCQFREKCHMTPSRKVSYHSASQVQTSTCQKHSPGMKRQMGKSLNCIHEAPISISNSQSSLTKSQSVNRVSEWKKGIEDTTDDNQVKKMSKMKSLRASLKNLFKKRKCTLDIGGSRERSRADSSQLSTSFITLNDDLNQYSSTA